jgi:phage shock protein PspC (stress-responsive transcriptional regulator)
MSRVRAFFAFLYDFVVGDDWRIAVGVVAGLALTYALSRTSVPAWWLLPVLLAVLLPASLWLATRRR